MKKHLSYLIFALVAVVALLAVPALAAGGADTLELQGSGMEGDPYLIETAQDLIALRDAVNTSGGAFTYEKYYLLKADIDLTTPELPGAGEWEPMNDFYGTFDGGDKTIKLKIDKSTETYVGFVRSLYGTIQNLTIDGSVTGQNYVGAFAGRLCQSDGAIRTSGEIEYCTNNASVTGVNVPEDNNTGDRIGGFAGGVYGTRSMRVIN